MFNSSILLVITAISICFGRFIGFSASRDSSYTSSDKFAEGFVCLIIFNFCVELSLSVMLVLLSCVLGKS